MFIPSKNLDLDRLNEEKEDFLTLDKRRNISNEFMVKMSPSNETSLERQIIGSKKLFEEGKQLKMKLEQSKQKANTQRRRKGSDIQSMLSRESTKNMKFLATGIKNSGRSSLNPFNGGSLSPFKAQIDDMSPIKSRDPVATTAQNSPFATKSKVAKKNDALEGVEHVQADEHVKRMKRYIKNSDKLCDNDIDKYISGLRNS
jgi:hypothetical protein